MSENLTVLPRQEELVSDEIKEIISYKPHWIIRKGNAIFFLIILLLFSLTFLLKYPDIVTASSRLVAVNPPKHITSKVEGKILKLFVNNEATVSKGQYLGYMESTAEYNQVVNLRECVDKITSEIQSNRFDILNEHSLNSFSNLGELQATYQNFQNELVQTKHILAGGYYRQKANSLLRDLEYLSSLKKDIQKQQGLQDQDKKLQEKEFEAYEQLAKEKVIAPLELNQYKSKLLAFEKSDELINSELTSNELSSHNKHKEILELQKMILDQKQKFYSSLLQLKSEIEKWISRFVLVAPENGKVLFVSSLQENELIASGQGLFYVQPHQTKVYAELMAPQKGLGKIRPGQKVTMKVESYPSSEFGYLAGRVNFISSIPNRQDSFLVKVDLPQGLKTNKGITIFFRNNFLAQAEIITDDRRLFDRLTGQFKQNLAR